jgi:tetracycline repressor-like protein
VLEDHLDRVSAAVETACERSRHQPLAAMVRSVVEAFVDAKMQRPDISTALYRIAAGIGEPALVQRTGERSRKALAAMLRTAPGARVSQQYFTAEMMFAAMAGATRTVLEAGAAPQMVRNCAITWCCFASRIYDGGCQPKRKRD